MILVFDLDDTLFDELSYVRSGFAVVADFIESEYGICSSDVFLLLERQLEKGRSDIFDIVFSSLGIFSINLVRRCVGIYRTHQPKIELYNEAANCLQRFAGYSLYIVTDGNKVVQKNKLTALGLYNVKPIKQCYVTHQYGLIHAKPSPYCFSKIVKREKIDPNKIVYIGDNSSKDFVGIKPFGFRTVRVYTGQCSTVKNDEQYEAEFKINNLDELTVDFISILRQT